MIHTTGNYYVCQSCVDCYGTCNNKSSLYYGMELGHLPWDGCKLYLSRRKHSIVDGHGRTKRKRRPKYPSISDFEFDTGIMNIL